MITPKYDLPTAIRVGAKLRGQTRTGHYYSHGRSCAVGAAIEAEGNRCPDNLVSNKLTRGLWPELSVYIDDYTNLEAAIIFLNDNALWTREEIADWLEVILP